MGTAFAWPFGHMGPFGQMGGHVQELCSTVLNPASGSTQVGGAQIKMQTQSEEGGPGLSAAEALVPWMFLQWLISIAAASCLWLQQLIHVTVVTVRECSDFFCIHGSWMQKTSTTAMPTSVQDLAAAGAVYGDCG